MIFWQRVISNQSDNKTMAIQYKKSHAITKTKIIIILKFTEKRPNNFQVQEWVEEIHPLHEYFDKQVLLTAYRLSLEPPSQLPQCASFSATLATNKQNNTSFFLLFFGLPDSTTFSKKPSNVHLNLYELEY